MVDGDTIVVANSSRRFTVRFLNVDTPETKRPHEPVQCMGPEATAFTKARLAPGTPVRLEYDVEKKDKYGRDLAVVSTDAVPSMSVALAEAGLGKAVVFQPNAKHYPAVAAAEKRAAVAQRGLYDPGLPCTPGQPVAQQPSQTPSQQAQPPVPVQPQPAQRPVQAPPQPAPAPNPNPHPNPNVQAPPAPSAPRVPVPQPQVPRPQAPSGGNPNVQTQPGGGYGTDADYPAYHGPRCYAPGGRVWKPC